MNEPNRSVTVDQVNWSSILLITRLPRALALSLAPNRIIMGFVLVVVLMATGTMWDAIFGSPVGPNGLGSAPAGERLVEETLRPILRNRNLVSAEQAEKMSAGEALSPVAVRRAIEQTFRARTAEERADVRLEVDGARMMIRTVEPSGVFNAASRAVVDHTRDLLRAAVRLECGLVLSHVVEMLRIPGLLFEHHLGFAIVFGVWALLVLLIGGAAMSRAAACQFAVERYIPWTEALTFALRRWIAIVGAPGLPLAGLAIGAVALALGGLLLAVPGLNLVGAVLYGLALLGSAIAACLLLLTLIAGALFVPAVAVESADAPDALARAFSFVRNRPLHWVVYGAASFVQGVFGLLVVALVAAVAVGFAAWGAGLIVSSPAIDAIGRNASITQILPPDELWSLTGTHRMTGGLIGLWRTAAAGLVAGWVLSYFWCVTTVLYFLMRKATDDQDLEEIWQPGLIEGTMAPGRAQAGEVGEVS